MYPNPQEALALPPHPDLEQYKKRAKALVRACRSGEPDAIRVWAVQWIEALASLQDASEQNREHVHHLADRITNFARTKLSSAGEPPSACSLAGAQFVMARVHGFASWPRFAAHLESLAYADSHASAFENAADAVVRGDATSVATLLREHPDLVGARSTREHNATLLHYVSANGVEGYRQKSPTNAAAIAELLLDAGAEVDAEADVYGGGWTTLGLVATSEPPAAAGVQLELIDVLLRHGARIAHGGSTRPLLRACLSNGQPEAAEYLVSRGAPLDLASAAATGRLEIVRRFFDPDGTSGPTQTDLLDALAFACTFGRSEVVSFLLDRGVDVNTEIASHGAGHTGLHVAAFHAHSDVVGILLRRGARVDRIDKTWKSQPLQWVLTGWARRTKVPVQRYYEVVAQLVGAGAEVSPDLFEWDRVRDDPKMVEALSWKGRDR
jgi:ankyrin repeat protein